MSSEQVPSAQSSAASSSASSSSEEPRSSAHSPSSLPPPRSEPRLSQLPPAEGAQRLAARLLDPKDLVFLDVLRAAGLAEQLEGDELLRVATAIVDADGLERRIDLLESYYGAGGDAALARARRTGDRFFLQHASDPVTAGALVARLAEITPELGTITLERIGGGADGPLVVRAGEHFSALLDDYEETLDTDEIDLRELEERRRAGGVTMVTVRGLVRAVNVLLDRHGVRDRMIALRSDDDREVYVATTVTEAIELARGGWLEDDDAEDVMELGGW